MKDNCFSVSQIRYAAPNQEDFTPMEYAAYITAIGALLVCLFLHFRRKRKKFARILNDHYTTRTFEPGSDPIDDRIEFHFINRRRD